MEARGVRQHKIFKFFSVFYLAALSEMQKLFRDFFIAKGGSSTIYRSTKQLSIDMKFNRTNRLIHYRNRGHIMTQQVLHDASRKDDGSDVLLNLERRQRFNHQFNESGMMQLIATY